MPGTSGAIRAGAAYTELFVDDNPLTRGLADASKKLAAWGASISSIGKKVALAGAGIVTPLFAASKVFGDMGKELGLAADKTGIGVEALSALSFAAARSGVEFDTLQVGIKKMQVSLVDAANGGQEAQHAYRQLGLSWLELGKMAPDQALTSLLDAIGKVENHALRTQLAVKTLGKGGADLLPLAMKGAAGIRALTEEAKQLGVVMSAADVAAARDFTGSMGRLGTTLKFVTASVGGSVAPVFTELLKAVIPHVAATAGWIRENKGLVVSLLKGGIAITGIGAGLFAVGKALSIVGLGFKAAQIGVNGLVIANKLLVGSFALVGAVGSGVAGIIGALATGAVSPLALVTAGLVGLGVAWFRLTDQGKAASGAWGDAWGNIKGVALASYGTIIESIMAGNLEGAFKVGAIAIKLVWMELVLALKATWIQFKDWFADFKFENQYLKAAFEAAKWIKENAVNPVANAVNEATRPDREAENPSGFGSGSLVHPAPTAAQLAEARRRDEERRAANPLAGGPSSIFGAIKAIFSHLGSGYRFRYDGSELIHPGITAEDQRRRYQGLPSGDNKEVRPPDAEADAWRNYRPIGTPAATEKPYEMAGPPSSLADPLAGQREEMRKAYEELARIIREVKDENAARLRKAAEATDKKAGEIPGLGGGAKTEGTFSAAGALLLAMGGSGDNIPQQQLDQQKNIRKGIEKIVDLAGRDDNTRLVFT